MSRHDTFVQLQIVSGQFRVVEVNKKKIIVKQILLYYINSRFVSCKLSLFCIIIYFALILIKLSYVLFIPKDSAILMKMNLTKCKKRKKYLNIKSKLYIIVNMKI